MFDDWKNAWREAVENFEREVNGESAGAGRVMRNQLNAARGALHRLDADIERAAAEAAAERESERICMRRQAMASQIDDTETVRLAEEYAARHAERAAIYERKTDVLQDERALLLRDIEHMETEIARLPEPDPAAAARTTRSLLDDDAEEQERLRQDRELEQLRRERAASERLEELKRRMRSE